MLVLNRLLTAAFANLFFFIANAGDQVGEEAHIGLEARRSGINPGGENRRVRSHASRLLS